MGTARDRSGRQAPSLIERKSGRQSRRCLPGAASGEDPDFAGCETLILSPRERLPTHYRPRAEANFALSPLSRWGKGKGSGVVEKPPSSESADSPLNFIHFSCGE